MSEPVKALSWRLYDEALPITEGLEGFAPPQVKEQLHLLDFGNALVKYPDRFWTRQRARLHNFAGFLNIFLPAALQFPAGGESLRQQQKAQLYDMELAYLHGLLQYVLLGFVTPRSVDAAPVEIPQDCWDGDFDWERHALQSGSLAFEGLRIVDLVRVRPALTAEWLDRGTVSAPSAPVNPPISVRSTAKKPGRKSAQAQVCEAVDELFPNPEFRKAAQKVQLEMVLQLLRGRDPGLDALLEKASPKTLQAHISRRLKALESSGETGGSIP